MGAPKVTVNMTITVEGATPAAARQLLSALRCEQIESHIYGTAPDKLSPRVANIFNEAFRRYPGGLVDHMTSIRYYKPKRAPQEAPNEAAEPLTYDSKEMPE